MVISKELKDYMELTCKSFTNRVHFITPTFESHLMTTKPSENMLWKIKRNNKDYNFANRIFKSVEGHYPIYGIFYNVAVIPLFENEDVKKLKTDNKKDDILLTDVIPIDITEPMHKFMTYIYIKEDRCYFDLINTTYRFGQNVIINTTAEQSIKSFFKLLESSGYTKYILVYFKPERYNVKDKK